MYRTLRIQPMRELVSMQNSMDRLLNTFFDADERTSFDTISPRVDMKQDENNIYVNEASLVSIPMTFRFQSLKTF